MDVGTRMPPTPWWRTQRLALARSRSWRRSIPAFRSTGRGASSPMPARAPISRLLLDEAVRSPSGARHIRTVTPSMPG